MHRSFPPSFSAKVTESEKFRSLELATEGGVGGGGARCTRLWRAQLTGRVRRGGGRD